MLAKSWWRRYAPRGIAPPVWWPVWWPVSGGGATHATHATTYNRQPSRRAPRNLPLLLLASLRPGLVTKFFKGGARAPWGEPREASVINIIIARINNNNRRIFRTSSISLYTTIR